MKRIEIGARPNWQDRAREQGFTFHTMHGEPYWDEASVYEFDLKEVETRIEDPSNELHAMCREAVGEIVQSEELMERLDIPRAHWDLVAQSWTAQEPELYGRFDLIYDGQGPAKMIEYNADTPTSLFEAASFQWLWLEDMIAQGRLPDDADQFNAIYEAISARFGEIFDPGDVIHFSAFEDNVEDYGTVETMAYMAKEAGLFPEFVDIRKIALAETGTFLDDEEREIERLFKLYPWEDMLRDDFAHDIDRSGCQMLEPAWKAVVSNKGILPVLWRMFEGHENLLPAFFVDELEKGSPAVERARGDLERGMVTKPVFSREGSSITITERGLVTEQAENRDYVQHPMIAQAYAPMPVMGGFRPVIGAWIVGQTCVGMGIREDRSRITQDLSRFKPHFLRP